MSDPVAAADIRESLLLSLMNNISLNEYDDRVLILLSLMVAYPIQLVRSSQNGFVSL